MLQNHPVLVSMFSSYRQETIMTDSWNDHSRKNCVLKEEKLIGMIHLKNNIASHSV